MIAAFPVVLTCRNKALELSQDALAERVGISTTNTSHIETGSTKLSLQEFADIADVLSRCTPSQAQALANILTAAKQAMDKHSG